MSRAWAVPIAGAIVAPLVTWLPMLAHWAPRLGLPLYQPAQGIDLWSTYTFWAAAIVLIAALTWDDDRWLAAALGAVALTLLWRGAYLDPTHSILFALGALGLWCVRRVPGRPFPARVRFLLATLGALQAIYVIQQSVFQYDVLWMIWGGPRVPVVQPLGTLGTVDSAGAYIAMTAPLMPLWFLPVSIYAVWCTKSLGATAALAVGLWAWCYRADRRLALAVGTVAAIPVALIVYWKLVYTLTDTVRVRLMVQWFGVKLAALHDPVLGWGLGGWARTVPVAQMQAKFMPTGEVFREAHSEPVQWACELGVVGLALLAGWLWTHRAMFHNPTWGASLSAAAVSAVGFFPLHHVATAFVILVMIGLATPAKPQPVLGGA